MIEIIEHFRVVDFSFPPFKQAESYKWLPLFLGLSIFIKPVILGLCRGYELANFRNFRSAALIYTNWIQACLAGRSLALCDMAGYMRLQRKSLSIPYNKLG